MPPAHIRLFFPVRMPRQMARLPPYNEVSVDRNTTTRTLKQGPERRKAGREPTENDQKQQKHIETQGLCSDLKGFCIKALPVSFNNMGHFELGPGGHQVAWMPPVEHPMHGRLVWDTSRLRVQRRSRPRDAHLRSKTLPGAPERRFEGPGRRIWLQGGPGT